MPITSATGRGIAQGPHWGADQPQRNALHNPPPSALPEPEPPVLFPGRVLRVGRLPPTPSWLPVLWFCASVT